ncbi:serine protease, S1-C subfamily, contains C-terminal PDZ domain [Bradyrhizobium lablabi]|uniref:Serine protease, S1-C subfamily, contains C-terminal PDZ domain n=1 Tax=Bradyrhizobium lablabi TaxID=722472 RepID=A0A1M6S0J2_9BRAD|nr:S1C family serine protease [Bradyrhizobium lablabi]SHK38170.1 serine protease, S1-C subfamily, contains C-terminal PDZ domain [Bradyrhizobium lablabi]
MTDQADPAADPLVQFSNALVARAETANNAVVAIRLAHGRHLTGLLWRSDIVVASEQSLPRKDEFELVAPGGSVVTAKIAGRDPSTNIAILRPATPLVAPSIAAGEAQTGAVALAIGADGTGAASARLGLVNLAGPEWHSSRGGLIDRRIVLDLRLAQREEGGPVFDAAGGCMGMSTFGPRGQVIAIPTATIERIVPQLLKDGRIARGWLGVALQAVAVPDALRETAGQSSGLMVMSVAEGGPAAQAGIVAGDIILSVDGTSTHRFRRLARLFGADSIGRKADLRLIRSGAVITVQATIAERQAA